MKRHIFFLASLLCTGLFLFTSCKKLTDAAKINIDLTANNVTFTIPQITATGNFTVADANAYLNIDSIIKANNGKLGVGNIRSVYMKSVEITLLNGTPTDNFSALQDGTIAVSSNSNAALQTIATVTNNPDVESYLLNIPVNSTVNLSPYFNATMFTYKMTGTARKTTSMDLQCKATIKYTLEAGL